LGPKIVLYPFLADVSSLAKKTAANPNFNQAKDPEHDTRNTHI
jgi:hypothetical protein